VTSGNKIVFSAPNVTRWGECHYDELMLDFNSTVDLLRIPQYQLVP